MISTVLTFLWLTRELNRMSPRTQWKTVAKIHKPTLTVTLKYMQNWKTKAARTKTCRPFRRALTSNHQKAVQCTLFASEHNKICKSNILSSYNTSNVSLSILHNKFLHKHGSTTNDRQALLLPQHEDIHLTWQTLLFLNHIHGSKSPVINSSVNTLAFFNWPMLLPCMG